ncbi:hypothetical protein PR048_024417 [Dryococelus australis]|uniref:Uncharacterized protein n=1 Tax=Dryococelus australis TaxID=614101 RepID=A0ABQ9GNM1_9NEOP|nr:hypothetical protein PR048_024417 [Dryococelus australis]
MEYATIENIIFLLTREVKLPKCERDKKTERQRDRESARENARERERQILICYIVGEWDWMRVRHGRSPRKPAEQRRRRAQFPHAKIRLRPLPSLLSNRAVRYPLFNTFSKKIDHIGIDPTHRSQRAFKTDGGTPKSLYGETEGGVLTGPVRRVAAALGARPLCKLQHNSPAIRHEPSRTIGQLSLLFLSVEMASCSTENGRPARSSAPPVVAQHRQQTRSSGHSSTSSTNPLVWTLEHIVNKPARLDTRARRQQTRSSGHSSTSSTNPLVWTLKHVVNKPARLDTRARRQQTRSSGHSSTSSTNPLVWTLEHIVNKPARLDTRARRQQTRSSGHSSTSSTNPLVWTLEHVVNKPARLDTRAHRQQTRSSGHSSTSSTNPLVWTLEHIVNKPARLDTRAHRQQTRSSGHSSKFSSIPAGKLKTHTRLSPETRSRTVRMRECLEHTVAGRPSLGTDLSLWSARRMDEMAVETHVRRTLNMRPLVRKFPHPPGPGTEPGTSGIAEQRGRGVVVRLLASHLGEPGSIPGGVIPGSSHVGILPDDAAGKRVFSGLSRFPRPFHCGAAPYLPRVALIGSQDLDVTSRPHLFAHSPDLHLNKRYSYKLQLLSSCLSEDSGLAFTPVVTSIVEVSGIGVARILIDRWSEGFLWDLPFPPPLQSGAAPYSPHFIISQELVKSRPNLSTQYITTFQNARWRRIDSVQLKRSEASWHAPGYHYAIGCNGYSECSPDLTPIDSAVVPLEISHPWMERRWNARAGETGVPRKNPPASGIVQHDSHMRISGSEPVGYRTRIAVVGGEHPSHCTTAAPLEMLTACNAAFLMHVIISLPRCCTAPDLPLPPSVGNQARVSETRPSSINRVVGLAIASLADRAFIDVARKTRSKTRIHTRLFRVLYLKLRVRHAWATVKVSTPTHFCFSLAAIARFAFLLFNYSSVHSGNIRLHCNHAELSFRLQDIAVVGCSQRTEIRQRRTCVPAHTFSMTEFTGKSGSARGDLDMRINSSHRLYAQITELARSLAQRCRAVLESEERSKMGSGLSIHQTNCVSAPPTTLRAWLYTPTRAVVIYSVPRDETDELRQRVLERCRNEGAGETGDPRENPPTNGIRCPDRGLNPVRLGGRAGALIARPPRPLQWRKCNKRKSSRTVCSECVVRITRQSHAGQLTRAITDAGTRLRTELHRHAVAGCGAACWSLLTVRRDGAHVRRFSSPRASLLASRLSPKLIHSTTGGSETHRTIYTLLDFTCKVRRTPSLAERNELLPAASCMAPLLDALPIGLLQHHYRVLYPLGYCGPTIGFSTHWAIAAPLSVSLPTELLRPHYRVLYPLSYCGSWDGMYRRQKVTTSGGRSDQRKGSLRLPLSSSEECGGMLEYWTRCLSGAKHAVPHNTNTLLDSLNERLEQPVRPCRFQGSLWADGPATICIGCGYSVLSTAAGENPGQERRNHPPPPHAKLRALAASWLQIRFVAAYCYRDGRCEYSCESGEVSFPALMTAGRLWHMRNPRDNPPTNGIVWHDSHMRKSGVTRQGIEPGSPWWEADSEVNVQGKRPVPRASRGLSEMWTRPHRRKQHVISPLRTHLLGVRLAYSPPTKANRVQSPVGSLRISHVGIVPNDAADRRVFSGDLQFSPPLHSRAAPYLASTLAGFQDHEVKGRSKFLHSTPLETTSPSSTLLASSSERGRQSLLVRSVREWNVLREELVSVRGVGKFRKGVERELVGFGHSLVNVAAQMEQIEIPHSIVMCCWSASLLFPCITRTSESVRRGLGRIYNSPSCASVRHPPVRHTYIRPSLSRARAIYNQISLSPSRAATCARQANRDSRAAHLQRMFSGHLRENVLVDALASLSETRGAGNLLDRTRENYFSRDRASDPPRKITAHQNSIELRPFTLLALWFGGLCDLEQQECEDKRSDEPEERRVVARAKSVDCEHRMYYYREYSMYYYREYSMYYYYREYSMYYYREYSMYYYPRARSSSVDERVWRKTDVLYSRTSLLASKMLKTCANPKECRNREWIISAHCGVTIVGTVLRNISRAGGGGSDLEAASKQWLIADDKQDSERLCSFIISPSVDIVPAIYPRANSSACVNHIRGDLYARSTSPTTLRVRIPAGLLASHQDEPGSNPSRVAFRVSKVGIVLDDAARRWIFSGISSLLRPCIPALLQSHQISPSSDLKTSNFHLRDDVTEDIFRATFWANNNKDSGRLSSFWGKETWKQSAGVDVPCPSIPTCLGDQVISRLLNRGGMAEHECNVRRWLEHRKKGKFEIATRGSGASVPAVALVPPDDRVTRPQVAVSLDCEGASLPDLAGPVQFFVGESIAGDQAVRLCQSGTCSRVGNTPGRRES